jgi:hypothetical protein
MCRVKIFYIPWIYPHFPDNKFLAITGNYGGGTKRRARRDVTVTVTYVSA